MSSADFFKCLNEMMGYARNEVQRLSLEGDEACAKREDIYNAIYPHMHKYYSYHHWAAYKYKLYDLSSAKTVIG